MNEESIKVLRMVADGKLSAEQADELLAVLGDEHQAVADSDEGLLRSLTTDAGQSIDPDVDQPIAMQRGGVDSR